MWVDLLISAPVTMFLVWLYWYSAPDGRPGWLRTLDLCLLALAPLVVAAIIIAGHVWIDYPGMGLNVILVASAYLTLISLLGAGWLQRAKASRRRDADPGS